VFDRVAYERDGRIIRVLTRVPVSIAIVIGGLVVVFLGLIVLDELDRRGDRLWQTIAAPTAPPRGSPLANRPVEAPTFAMPPMSPETAKEMRDRLIRGELDRGSFEAFRKVPDYDRCQRCLSECDAKAASSETSAVQECRRNCLRTCSEYSRQWMDL